MRSLLESSVGTDELAAQIETASSQLLTQQRQLEGFAQETSKWVPTRTDTRCAIFFYW